MKIKYYGTGDGYGIPEPFCSCRLCRYAREHGGKDIRTRSQAAVGELMIDCSADMLAHTLFYGLDMRRYRHILVTHGHGDHYAAGDMTSRYTDSEKWHVYLPQALAERERERFRKIAEGNAKTPPQAMPVVHEVKPFEPFCIGDYQVTALPSNHMSAGEAVLYLIRQGGKTVFWVHDSGLLMPETIDYLKRHPVHMDYVSMDCTLARGSLFCDTHMDIEQCAETAEALRSIGCVDADTRLVLSHMGHLIDRTHAELEAEAREFGFVPAYDTMETEI